MTHDLALRVSTENDGRIIPEDQRLEGNFLSFVITSAFSNDGRILRRIGKVSSQSTLDLVLLLRQVSKEFNGCLVKLLAQLSLYRLVNRISLDTFSKSNLTSVFDTFRVTPYYIRMRELESFMQIRLQNNAPPLKLMLSYGQDTGMLGLISNCLSCLPEDNHDHVFGTLEKLQIVDQPHLSVHRAAGTLRKFHALKHLVIDDTPFSLQVLNQLTDAELTVFLATVKTVYFRKQERSGDPRICARILRHAGSPTRLRIFYLSRISDIISLLTDEELSKLFHHVRSLDLSDSSISPDQLLRVFRAVSSCKVEFTYESCMAFSRLCGRLSDLDYAEFFRPLKSLKLLSDVSILDYSRILNATHALEDLALTERGGGLNDVIEDMNPDELERVFRTVKRLELSGSENHVLNLDRILRATLNLKSLTLSKSNNLSEVILELPQETLYKIFSRIKSLHILNCSLTAEALKRIMSVARSLVLLEISELEKSKILDSLMTEDFQRYFGDLCRLVLKNFSISVESMIDLLRAARSLVKLKLEAYSKSDKLLKMITDEEVEAFSRKIGFMPFFKKDLSGESLGRLLKVDNSLRYDDVSDFTNFPLSIRNLSDQRLAQLMQTACCLYKMGNSIASYKLLKTNCKLDEFRTLDFSDLPSVIRALSDQELERLFEFLSDLEINSKIPIDAIKKILKAVRGLSILCFNSVDKLSELIESLTDDDLSRICSNLEKLTVTSNLNAEGFQRILKGTRGLRELSFFMTPQLNDAIEMCSDDELDEIFRSVEYLNIIKQDGQESALKPLSFFRIFNSIQSPKGLSLRAINVLPAVLDQLSDDKQSTLFANMVEMNILYVQIQFSHLKMILQAAPSMTKIKCTLSGLGDRIDALTDEELCNLFKSLTLIEMNRPMGNELLSIPQKQRLERLLPNLTFTVLP